MKYVSPIFLVSIFLLWLAYEVFGIAGGHRRSSYVDDLFVNPNLVAILSVGVIIVVGLFVALILSGSPLFRRLARDAREKLP